MTMVGGTSNDSSSSSMSPVLSPSSSIVIVDLYGKRRQFAKVQVLEREISLLQDEIKSLAELELASRCCKELDDYVEATPDPLIAFFAHLALAFGLGNVVSFMVFLSPLPTFYKIYKKKSTEGFQSVPYVVSLFSAMLWIYYALLKANAMLLITINSVGCFIQTFYICFFLFYAPKKAKIESLTLIGLIIVVGFGLIIGLTQFLAHGANRVAIVG